MDLVGTLAAIVDEGSLDAAARRLQLTPSAVSQRLATLERQVGRVLLVRVKPVRPTEAGRALVRLARQVALVEHDALAELVELGGPVIDVALFWQQWKVPSDLLDEIAAAIVAEGRRVLEPRASG